MNNTTTKKKIITVAIVAVLMLSMIAVALWGEDYITYHPTVAEPIVDETGTEITVEKQVGDTSDQPVIFSLDCGFYSTNETLYLSAPNAVEIRYTKDGSEPSESGRLYKDGISIKADSNETKIYTIKACAVYEDGTCSEPVVRSYITGGNISERFDCLVFSITVDPDVLYDYETGIFVAGKLRDDWLAETGTRASDAVPTDPANWNWRGKASERECYVEVFEYDGECVISQTAGMRIFGGWSRANEQKNIRLYARSEYDETDNRFRYEFFPDALDSNGSKITSYNKLSLRTCANDAGYLYLRDDMISDLAHATGVDAKYSRPCAVFLNGEYYCFAWVQQTFSEDLLEHTYAIEQAEWDILKGCEYMIWEDDDNDIEQATADWFEMYSYAYKDLTDDATYAELCEMIDIDNFLTYYALNSYLGNGDWPNNNWKVYRYVSGTAYEGQYPCDGKWRFMLYDTDFCLGLYGNDAFSRHIAQLFDEEYFGLMPEDWVLDVHDDGDKYKRSDLLIALCKREDVRERFLCIMSDMINWYYSEERVSDHLDLYNTLRLHELVEASNVGKASVWNVSNELNNVKQYMPTRAYAAKSQLKSVFPEYDEVYYVYCSPTEGATITVNTATITPDEEYIFSGWYFKGTEVTLTCELAYGYEFDHWDINGEKIYDMSTPLSAEIYGDRASIELVVHNAADELIISEVCYKGSTSDYIVIKNPTEQDVTIKNYALTDGANAYYTIPTTTIKAGRELKILCKNYSKSDAIGSIQCGFNLKEYETVYLYNGSGELIYELYLPDGSDNTVRKFNELTGTYYEATNETKSRILEAELPQRGNWGGWGW